MLRISPGGRPEMPGNAQVIWLTIEVWNLLDSRVVGDRIRRNDPQWGGHEEMVKVRWR